MKNTLFYYYGLAPEKIIKKDNYYYFYLDNYIYYLYQVNRPLEYINELIMLTRTVNYSNFMMIIFNINKEALSIINNRYYILLRSLKMIRRLLQGGKFLCLPVPFFCIKLLFLDRIFQPFQV